MQNCQGIAFIQTQTYREIFKSAFANAMQFNGNNNQTFIL